MKTRRPIRRGPAPRGLAVAAATAVLVGGLAVAPAAFAAPAADTCRGVSTVGLYCGYHTGTKWAELGSTGAHVKEIQALINETTRHPQASGARLAVDGIFGPDTKAAVTWFQWYYIGESASDGIVGPQTWGELRYGKR
ncbi:peptidoglycan-binding domain-containing protein [Streptomyces sp. TRM68416]|uniref:peptidoglycan-binding domain-containing protein n=1 Tax=Streptomyces sp. TRM68416 TaxID=2758412 RepID=UPI001661F40D|nr:peptidoglycan-binding domain-containing protein [Streptomyces sp. TRM68416]MBD0839284.1 peptidoglycan-binding protein [Streptomyces sp. TRM68416]